MTKRAAECEDCLKQCEGEIAALRETISALKKRANEDRDLMTTGLRLVFANSALQAEVNQLREKADSVERSVGTRPAAGKM